MIIATDYGVCEEIDEVCEQRDEDRMSENGEEEGRGRR